MVISTSGETSRFFKILTDDNNVYSAVHMIAYINIDIPAQCFDFEVSVTTRKIKKKLIIAGYQALYAGSMQQKVSSSSLPAIFTLVLQACGNKF